MTAPVTTPRARVAVLSRRGVEQKVWHASQFEFEDVIADIDDARLLLPRPAVGGPRTAYARHTLNRLGKPFGIPRRAAMSPPDDAFAVDLFFAVFAAPHEIGALPFVKPQLSMAARRVAFIVEMYTTDLPSTADYIRQLRGFDHIYVFTRDVLPAVREITGVPTSFLATGVDALRFAPSTPAPSRSIDVTSYGRRLAVTHAALRQAESERGLNYHYDTVRGVFEVSDFRDHRDALAATLQRSDFAVIYKNNDEQARVQRTGGEETLTNRYFEAMSAGAIVLGSAPDIPDFDSAFPWQDAVIPIPAPAPAIADLISDLQAQRQRLEAARTAGIRAGLERHDWSYRWRVVLDSVGLPEHERFMGRRGEIEERSATLRYVASPRSSAPTGAS